ncbi:hypothetical protein F2Q69_00047879 [Brassica cretica]|uniref:Uncharacterized protein n=1 Tax=Brassica cretica TaxID=69181 RepID=A0A8S9PFH0_BRACR|nr:hypothetical protein F2Q69_00047879 [Brassica cretica]
MPASVTKFIEQASVKLLGLIPNYSKYDGSLRMLCIRGGRGMVVLQILAVTDGESLQMLYKGSDRIFE